MIKTVCILSLIISFLSLPVGILAEIPKPELVAEDAPEDTSIIVNGDEVEYLTDKQAVVARGNVEVLYKGAQLTADTLSVNTAEKRAEAAGNIRLQQQGATIQGEKGWYDFEAQTGEFIDAWFWMDPYFGRAKRVEKVSETKVIAHDCYITTSSYDVPEYRFRSRRVEIYLGDKIRTKSTTIVFGDAPVAWLPYFNRSLKDPFMHGRVIPGKNSDWGGFLLNYWRYNLAEDLDMRVYLDYRHKLGVAEGIGLNYQNKPFGAGDFKFYYTREKPDDLPADLAPGAPEEYERFLMRWRHLWHIDERTDLLAEWYEIGDERRKILDPERSFLKDYFPREYEEDSEPLTYLQVHRNFRYSTLDVLYQERSIQWFDQLEKRPEIKYTLPNVQILNTPFYIESASSLVNHNKKAETAPVSANHLDVVRFDTLNKLSMPMRVSVFHFTPFIGSRETIYDKGADDKDLPVRTIFLTGADVSTKFFRTFDLKTDAFGLNINRLRHIITPTVAYEYLHEPTVLSRNIQQIDSIDTLGKSNTATLGLSNKLQTKRNDQNVDIADLRVSTSYVFKPETADKKGSSFSDYLIELDLMPYSWLSFDSDATYKHSGSRNSEGYHKFSSANYNIGIRFGDERSFGIGQRYERKAGNEITSQFAWRFNPKWKFSVYNRYEIGHDVTLKRGWKEQEYTVSRDLHSWIMDVTYNVRKTEGETIWLVFRLKAFPEFAFGFDQSYHEPKSGSQSQ